MTETKFNMGWEIQAPQLIAATNPAAVIARPAGCRKLYYYFINEGATEAYAAAEGGTGGVPIPVGKEFPVPFGPIPASEAVYLYAAAPSNVRVTVFGSELGEIDDIPAYYGDQATLAAVVEADPVERGIYFEYTDTESITLDPNDLDGNAVVKVSNGSDLLGIELAAPLVADITVAGAGGLDAGAEAASTVYICRLITEAGGANPALLLTASGSAPALPGAYTHASRPLCSVANDTNSDFMEFWDMGNRRFRFNSTGDSCTDDNRVATNLTNTVPTIIDCSDVVPEEAVQWSVTWRAKNSNSPTNNCTLYEYDGVGYVPIGFADSVDDGARQTSTQRVKVKMRTGAAATLAHAWSVATNFGTTITVDWVQL